MAAEFRYAAHASRTSRRRLFFATILVIVIVLLDLLTGGKVRAAIRQGASALWGADSHVWSAIQGSGYFSSRKALESQISVLQSELDQSQERAAAFSVAQEENVQLSALTHLAQTSPGTTAPVTSSFISSPYGTFLIGAGSADGIVQNALVLTSDGFLVGVVSDLGSHTALVKEVFAPNSSVDVVVDGASATASGQGGGVGSVSIPRGITITPGEPVLAPEYGSRPVGVVGHVNSDPASAQLKVLISLPVSLSSLQFVYVVTP